MTLGDVISDYRAAHSMSMDKFASLADISKGYISMLERNQTQRGEEPSPSLEMYCKVAKVIGIDFDDLIRMVNGKIVIGKSDSEPQTNKVSDNAMSIARAYDKATPEEQSEVNDILFRYIEQSPRSIVARGGGIQNGKLSHPELGLEDFKDDTDLP